MDDKADLNDGDGFVFLVYLPLNADASADGAKMDEACASVSVMPKTVL